MHYCHYHPDTTASYYCHTCHAYSCDACSKETSHASCRCFVCNSDLESLGTGLSAEPFWRRLDQTFRYAFNAETLIFIAGVTVLSTLLMFAPGIWSRVFLLIVVSAYIKYCFVCLEKTAFGNMQPPSITSAYDDGVFSLLKLAFVFIFVFGMCTVAFTFLGLNVGTLVSVALISALPAAIIILALEGSPISAVNPLRLWRVITSIGFAYGVLLAFILIMSSSVAILSNLFADGFSILGLMAQNFISSFYTVVMFHMMGYMIYQYQNNLGFTARDDELERKIRTDTQKRHAHINMLLREGRFEQVAELYARECELNSNDTTLLKQYFEYLLALKDKARLVKVADKYVKSLVETGRFDEARLAYKQMTHLFPAFKPTSTHIRYRLAKSFHEKNDSMVAVAIINGIHKDDPEFEQLPEAYDLCATILGTVSGRQKDADNFKRYSQMVAQKRAQQAAKKAQQQNRMLVPKSDTVNQKNTKEGSTSEHHSAVVEKESSDKEVEGIGLSGLSLVPMDEH